MKGSNAFGTWTVLILAGVAGLAALGLTRVYLDQREAEIREQYSSGDSGKQYMVVVATQSISPGDVASPKNMRGEPVPGKHLPATAVTVEDFKRGNVAGRVVNQPMRPGEPLLRGFLAGGASDRFSDLLEPGERAVTLTVDQISSNAGMLEMGDYVDLYLRMDSAGMQSSGAGTGGSGNDGETLVPLRDRVRVLAVGHHPLRTRDQDFTSRPRNAQEARRTASRRDQYATVTVALDEKEAARVSLAREKGELVFLLRNAGDPGGGIQRIVGEQSIWEAASARGSNSGITFYAPSRAEGFMINPGHLRIQQSRTDTDRRVVKSKPIVNDVKGETREGEQ